MREFIDGATAVARGALDSGCDFFAGYPISPATPLLLHMIRELPKTGGVAIQAEDEIAAICMCIGAAMTGGRALTATSGPGISLYSENIGLAIMGEVPLVIVDVQRLGPATGGATTPGQGDVQFVRWSTSGGYPIIALAPSSVAECYSFTRRAFDLAERFRCPVFLLTDKEMFLSMSTVEVAAYESPPVRARAAAAATPEDAFIPHGLAPMDALPFTPIGGSHIVRFTGSSHDEYGFLTKNPVAIGRLNEHLRCKIEDHADEIDFARSDLQEDASTLFISYGITARAMAEAVLQARTAGRAVSSLTVQSLWPVPEAGLIGALCGLTCAEGVERVVVAELNHGDFRREVERVIYRWAAETRRRPLQIVGIHRVDGELITPSQFLEALLA
ncbi:MAG: pyruvate flavodoxin/ferredoxin oxidoreductase [Anaerolineae bacterium]|nr:pyruvate flavodoxin/ferredoxin oxidoreductase [Anaerolineae bacterium]